MKCSYPVPIKKKDGSLVLVPCLQCRACRLNYRSAWKVRFAHELCCHQFNSWIELSYDNEHLDEQNEKYKDIDGKMFSLERKEVQDWLKRFRKEIAPLKIRYFGCGEYGSDEFGTHRPHYHLALFGISPDHPAFGPKVMKSKSGWWHKMPSWPFGMVWVDNNPPSLRVGAYIAKYIMKKHKGPDAKSYYDAAGINPEFVMMSLRPGIGALKIDENTEYYLNNPVFHLAGKNVPLSRYMKERICANRAKELAATYKDLPNYDDFYQQIYANVMSKVNDKVKDYAVKHGLERKFMTSADCWHEYGEQQERNLKRYEKD